MAGDRPWVRFSRNVKISSGVKEWISRSPKVAKIFSGDRHTPGGVRAMVRLGILVKDGKTFVYRHGIPPCDRL